MTGLHKHRLKKECDNPREVVFYKEWQKENKIHTPDLLTLLFSIEDGSDVLQRRKWLALGPPTKRDQIAVATVIQWLGSNVGFDFLSSALERCGYKIMKVKP